MRVFCVLVLLGLSLVWISCSGESGEPASQGFDAKVYSLQWVAFSPTHFDPTRVPPVTPSDAELKADLHTLRPYFDGIITYGLDLALDRVPVLAREEGFKGVIVGIWDIRSSREVELAKALSIQGIIDAICVGNEGLMAGRYGWEDLQKTMEELRLATHLPLTTSEAIHLYEDQRLLHMDFLLPNIHPVWNGQPRLEDAVEWVEQQALTLVKVGGGRPILIKETGFPSSTPWDEKAQASFYEELEQDRRRLAADTYVFAYFEAFDQPWKTEMLNGNNIGGSWGVFAADRRPKMVIGTLSRL